MIGQNNSQVNINPKIMNILAKQQNDLVNKPPDCVIFQQNPDGDILDIQADIIGPVGTPYEGGVFKCKLVIDSEFPQKPPKGYFLTKIFHPNVATPSGEICVNTLKKDWNPTNWSLSHIFEVIKCLLIVPFPESSLNEEAGREFMENYDDFFKNAKVFTGVYAKPTQAMQKIIEQHMQLHYKANKEEQKQAPSQSVDSQNQYQPMHIDQCGQQPFHSQQSTYSQFGMKEQSVLNQVTNQFVQSQVIEGKGEMMCQQELNNMTKTGGSGVLTGSTGGLGGAQKKPAAAADPKKKWMRRI